MSDKRRNVTNYQIAVVGNPNSGKTTIFNFLTRSFQKTGNWHGVTVEPQYAEFKCDSEHKVTLVDLPGINNICNCNIDSLKNTLNERTTSFDYDELERINYNNAKATADQIETCKILRLKQVDYVINVIDASRMHRDLYLTMQLIEMGFNLLVVINKNDIAVKRGIKIDVNKLKQILKCDVILLSSKNKNELQKFKNHLKNQSNISDLFNQIYELNTSHIDLDIASKALNNHIGKAQNSIIEEEFGYSQILQNLTDEIYRVDKRLKRWQAIRILEGDDPSMYITDLPVKEQNEKVNNVLKLLKKYNKEQKDKVDGEVIEIVIANNRYKLIDQIFNDVVSVSYDEASKKRFNLDSLILNDWFAIPILIIVLQLMFLFTINVGNFFQLKVVDLSEFLVFEPLKTFLLPILNLSHYFGVFYKGLSEGIKAVIAFTPIIWSLYFFMAILEESGYMARAAFSTERILNRIGLPGKAIIPLIIGFGCNVPAVMAARNIENGPQRVATIMMIPFMSCSARLTVFALFGAIFFNNIYPYIIMFLYLCGIAVGISVSYIFRAYLQFKQSNLATVAAQNQNYFILELPDYDIPKLSLLFGIATRKTKYFITGVGKTITIIALIFNIMMMISMKGKVIDNIEDSVLADIGKGITPVFTPIGLSSNNWEASVSLVSGILAKEVVVGTLGTLYGSEIEDNKKHDIKFSEGGSTEVENEIIDNNNLNNIVKVKFGNEIRVISYLLFVLLYFPCISVYAVVKKELNAKYAFISVAWSTIIAYMAALVFYQLSDLFGITSFGWAAIINVCISISSVSLLSFLISKIFMWRMNKIII